MAAFKGGLFLQGGTAYTTAFEAKKKGRSTSQLLNGYIVKLLHC